MTLKEAINAVLTILKQVMEEKLNSTNVEVVTVTPEKLFHMFTKEEVEQVRLCAFLRLFTLTLYTKNSTTLNGGCNKFQSP